MIIAYFVTCKMQPKYASENWKTYIVHNFDDHSGSKPEKQGNSVARDLPRTGSKTNNTIFVIYILDIDSHCPYLLSGETTFQLTSCQNSLHVYLQFGETISPI